MAFLFCRQYSLDQKSFPSSKSYIVNSSVIFRGQNQFQFLGEYYCIYEKGFSGSRGSGAKSELCLHLMSLDNTLHALLMTWHDTMQTSQWACQPL